MPRPDSTNNSSKRNYTRLDRSLEMSKDNHASVVQHNRSPDVKIRTDGCHMDQREGQITKNLIHLQSCAGGSKSRGVVPLDDHDEQHHSPAINDCNIASSQETTFNQTGSYYSFADPSKLDAINLSTIAPNTSHSQSSKTTRDDKNGHTNRHSYTNESYTTKHNSGDSRNDSMTTNAELLNLLTNGNHRVVCSS